MAWSPYRPQKRPYLRSARSRWRCSCWRSPYWLFGVCGEAHERHPRPRRFRRSFGGWERFIVFFPATAEQRSLSSPLRRRIDEAGCHAQDRNRNAVACSRIVDHRAQLGCRLDGEGWKKKGAFVDSTAGRRLGCRRSRPHPEYVALVVAAVPCRLGLSAGPRAYSSHVPPHVLSACFSKKQLLFSARRPNQSQENRGTSCIHAVCSDVGLHGRCVHCSAGPRETT